MAEAPGPAPAPGVNGGEGAPGSSLGAAVAVPDARVSPSRRVTPHCLWKRLSSAFLKCFANEKLKKGQSSIISLDFKGASERVGFGGKVLLSVVSLWQ